MNVIVSDSSLVFCESIPRSKFRSIYRPPVFTNMPSWLPISRFGEKGIGLVTVINLVICAMSHNRGSICSYTPSAYCIHVLATSSLQHFQ